MLDFFYILFCSALFVSCKKQSDQDCALVSVQSGDFFPTITTYEYDQQGRIVKVVGPLPCSLTYYRDSIVVTDQANITTYYITSSGLATSAKSRSSFPDATQQVSEYNYTYNPEGYLIQVGSVYSRLVNGIMTRDTFNWSFTIQNGNITEYRSGNILLARYDYTNLIAKENMAFTNQPVYQWSFLGRFSRNLISRKPTFNASVSFFYEFDDNGNVSKRKEYHHATPGPLVTYYRYQCN